MAVSSDSGVGDAISRAAKLRSHGERPRCPPSTGWRKDALKRTTDAVVNTRVIAPPGTGRTLSTSRKYDAFAPRSHTADQSSGNIRQTASDGSVRRMKSVHFSRCKRSVVRLPLVTGGLPFTSWRQYGVSDFRSAAGQHGSGSPPETRRCRYRIPPVSPSADSSATHGSGADADVASASKATQPIRAERRFHVAHWPPGRRHHARIQ